MLKGLKPLTAAAVCLLGLSAFAQSAAAAQWVDSGRTAYVKTSFFGSFAYHTCDSSGAQIQGYPGSCGSDAGSGWTSNYTASSDLANSQLMACNHNPFQLGSACYGLAYAINGQAYAGGLPAPCRKPPHSTAATCRRFTGRRTRVPIRWCPRPALRTGSRRFPCWTR